MHSLVESGAICRREQQTGIPVNAHAVLFWRPTNSGQHRISPVTSVHVNLPVGDVLATTVGPGGVSVNALCRYIVTYRQCHFKFIKFQYSGWLTVTSTI